ncbi:MAG: C39 family peptidase [Cyanobacteria bacterium]|nr:C39 family peptidase [Cyanobacteriota bacterium]
MAEPMSAERFLERWQNYRDQPQQVAAVRALHAAIAALEGGAQILDELAPWARQFSQKPAPAPTPQPLPKKTGNGGVALALPFFDQNNDGPDGWRHCQSSSIAMNLAYLGVPGIKDDLDYLKVVQRHGDTTQQAAHAAALAELKAPGRFISSCSVERAKAELDKGFGLAIGILHHGPVSAPSGGGHYITVRGYDATGWLVHDPYGELDLVRGGWARQGQRAGRSQHYSFANTNPRWLLEGPSSGWAWIFSS